MDEMYYIVYDKGYDVYMERYDWGNGEVDEDSYTSPSGLVNFNSQEDAEKERVKYSNADELIVVKVSASYVVEELEPINSWLPLGRKE